MKQTTLKQRLVRLSLIVLAILILGFTYLILFRSFGFRIPCPLYELTGWDCPGCGLTRAAGAISRFSFIEALGYNPMLPLYALYFGWFGGTYAFRYLRGDPNPMGFGGDWIHVVMLILTVAFGILRNLLPIDTI